MSEIIMELLKAIGKMFLNPIVYWFFILAIFMSKRRIKAEQAQFQRSLFPFASEWSFSLYLSIFASISISIISIIFHIHFVSEIILFISVILFVFSFAFGYRALSAAYTLGITFIILKILESFGNQLFLSGLINHHSFSSIALLIALFLFFEANLYAGVTNETSFPELVKSKRGSWIGLYHLQRASFIPFFVFLPGKLTIASVPIIPYFTIGVQEFSFAFIPMVIGFHHIISGQLPGPVAQRFARYNSLLFYLVLVTALTSFYLPGIASISILLAVIGKLYINYSLEKEDQKKDYAFIELDNPLKIFAIVQGSPAAALGLQVGDQVIAVNDQEIYTAEALKEALLQMDDFPIFTIMSPNHEVIQIDNEQFKGSLDELGIILPEAPKEVE